MSLTTVLADTVDILDAPTGVEDDFGLPTGSWTVGQAARKARVSGSAGGAGADEDRTDQEQAFARKVLYLDPADGAVSDRQRIRWDGRDWLIVEVHPAFGRAATHHLRLIIEQAH